MKNLAMALSLVMAFLCLNNCTNLYDTVGNKLEIYKAKVGGVSQDSTSQSIVFDEKDYIKTKQQFIQFEKKATSQRNVLFSTKSETEEWITDSAKELCNCYRKVDFDLLIKANKASRKDANFNMDDTMLAATASLLITLDSETLIGGKEVEKKMKKICPQVRKKIEEYAASGS